MAAVLASAIVGFGAGRLLLLLADIVYERRRPQPESFSEYARRLYGPK